MDVDEDEDCMLIHLLNSSLSSWNALVITSWSSMYRRFFSWRETAAFRTMEAKFLAGINNSFDNIVGQGSIKSYDIDIRPDYILNASGKQIGLIYLIKSNQFSNLEYKRSVQHLHQEIHSGPACHVVALIIDANANTFRPRRPHLPAVQVHQDGNQSVEAHLEVLGQILEFQFHPSLLAGEYVLEERAPRR
ncbi:hypothetical protein RHMOL_Rhmol05G0017900 [Rhododendron molle]|uniref:Uncharacterized protein n=1 Tax=Rhododendron molle TaxID=49168 RepID=A0ACC0NJM1_RHOML|nr:hypothetical protein RHMOL_Rhmol05G0017900 [Rhododendron molle]